MKKLFTCLTAMLFATGLSAQTTFTTNVTVNTAVPDNDPSGLASGFSLAGLGGSITNLSVTLNFTGGYNGDLFASLVGSGGFAVLLNRVGVSGSNPNGYGDTGMAVMFRPSAPHVPVNWPEPFNVKLPAPYKWMSAPPLMSVSAIPVWP